MQRLRLFFGVYAIVARFGDGLYVNPTNPSTVRTTAPLPTVFHI
jgi:hypothetical protein